MVECIKLKRSIFFKEMLTVKLLVSSMVYEGVSSSCKYILSGYRIH